MSTPTHDPNGLPPMDEYREAVRGVVEAEQRRRADLLGEYRPRSFVDMPAAHIVDDGTADRVAAGAAARIALDRGNPEPELFTARDADGTEYEGGFVSAPPPLVVTMQGHGVVGTATNDNGTLTLTITDPLASAVLRGATAPLSVSLLP